jgi:CBS domain containing-hemolysin-like protein
MPVYINIIIILILFFFNAIFAMYEIAMVASKRVRLQQRVEKAIMGQR